jgi:ABC-type proline/glycine betaine transport system permease subunit
LDDKFKTGLLLVLISLVINILLGIMVGIFITKQLSYGNPLWVIHPILGLFSVLALIVGGKKILSVVQ